MTPSIRMEILYLNFRSLLWISSMDVIADTTAMSVPHEIEYTLTFASDSITSGKQAAPGQQIIYLAVVVAAGVVVVILTKKKKSKEV